jgi:hypothetical protein
VVSLESKVLLHHRGMRLEKVVHPLESINWRAAVNALAARRVPMGLAQDFHCVVLGQTVLRLYQVGVGFRHLP